MPSTAGLQLVAGRIPGERIATNIRTGDSSTFTTTETTVDSVTAALVSGRTYRVRWTVQWASSVANDDVAGRIREDNSTGTELAFGKVRSLDASSTGWSGWVEGEYTAVSTGNKTFVWTGVRFAGTGNCRAEAATTRPIYLYVDYISG